MPEKQNAAVLRWCLLADMYHSAVPFDPVAWLYGDLRNL